MIHETAGSTESVRVECLDPAVAFDQLQTVWQGLERRDTQCTPFNTWVWNSLWWHHYGTARDRLTLLIARQGNRVVGIAPLYIHATRMCKVIPVHVLRFIGSGRNISPDYLNIIALPECRHAAERAFVHYLPRVDGWHKLHLANMLLTSSLARRVREFVNSRPGLALTPQRLIIQKEALPATFDDYRRQPDQQRCKQINHRQSRLEAAGLSELSLCATSEELVEACDALGSLHRLRRQSRQETGDFRSSVHEQFQRAVIRQFFAMDAMWLATLKLDGKIIGVHYIFVWRGELLFMQGGYSPEHENLSPEHVLFTYVMQRGIEQGMVGLDMLKGHFPCQSANARYEVQTVEIGYIRPGVRQFIGGARDRLARMRPEP